MRFVKASERLPEVKNPPYLVIVRWVTKGEHLSVATMTPNQLADKLRWDIAGVYEWLDESLPASIEDEAEKLYPYADKNVTLSTVTYNSIMDVQRETHITCARQYMDTIEKLRAENSKLRKALEEDGWIKIKDFALANMPDYDELVLWRDESGKYFCEMLDKDGNPWLEEPYKVTHYKKIIPPEH